MYSEEFRMSLLRLPVDKWPSPVAGLAHLARGWVTSPDRNKRLSSGEEREASVFLAFCMNALLTMASDLVRRMEVGEVNEEVGVTFSVALTSFSRAASSFAQFLEGGDLISTQAGRGDRGRAAAAAGIVHLFIERAIENGVVNKQQVPEGLEIAWGAIVVVLGREAEVVARILSGSDNDNDESELVLV